MEWAIKLYYDTELLSRIFRYNKKNRYHQKANTFVACLLCTMFQPLHIGA